MTQKRAFAACHMLQIDYDKINQEDLTIFEKVCSMSPLLRNYINQRGKVLYTKHGKGKKKKK